MADALEQLLAQELLSEASSSTASDLGGLFDSIGKTGLELITQDARLPTSQRQYGIGDAIGVGLISGLLGGGFNAVGRDIRTDNLAGISDILTGRSSSAGDLEPSLYKKATSYRDLLAKNQRDVIAQDVAKAGIDVQSTNKKELFKNLLDNPQKTIKTLDMLYGGNGEKSGPTAGDSEIASGPPTLTQKLIDTTQKLVDSGMPATQAAAGAKKIHAGDIARLETIREQSQAARDKANKLTGLSDQADLAISRAGQTGGIYNSQLGNLASYLYSAVSPEEAAQRGATAELESLGPDILAMSRVKGSGAMSDFESKMYIGSGPSALRQPAENKALIEKSRNVARLENEYADFVDWYTDTFETDQGLAQTWSQYKAENPVIVDTGNGNMVWNQNRTPWGDWVASKASNATEPSFGAGADAGGSAYSVGEMFNGERITGVRRIR